MDMMERDIFSLICQNDGIKAKEIGKQLNKERSIINRYLYCSPYMRELCYRDDNYLWHGMIRQMRPHVGISEFSGYYSTVEEFLVLEEEDWFEELKKGCRKIGRNLNNTRGLFHSFRDCYKTMRNLFDDLKDIYEPDWEIVFELRIKRTRYIRIYADVLVITGKYVFSLEFKMNDKIEEQELAQAVKYSSYQEVLFGPECEIIPVLVLTKAEDLYRYEQIPGSTAEVPVCSGDMLFNVFDEYLDFLQ